MVKATYKEKLLDPRWQRLRLEVMQRENFTCQYCANTKQTLNLHHLRYAESGNPWDVSKNDLLCLCQDCHYVLHVLEKETSLFSILMNEILFFSVISMDNNSDIKILVQTANKRIIDAYPKKLYNSK